MLKIVLVTEENNFFLLFKLLSIIFLSIIVFEMEPKKISFLKPPFFVSLFWVKLKVG